MPGTRGIDRNATAVADSTTSPVNANVRAGANGAVRARTRRVETGAVTDPALGRLDRASHTPASADHGSRKKR